MLKGGGVCRYVQWCHGAPGFIPLLTKAYELLDGTSSDAAAAREQILSAAKKAADVVWERGLLTKVTDCQLASPHARSVFIAVSRRSA